MVVTPVVDQYLVKVVARIESIFGRRLAGVWLLGSASYGGFNDRSDLDVQAAIEGPPSAPEVERVVELIGHDRLRCPAAGLEFVLYDRAILAEPTPPLQWALNFNDGASRPTKVSTDPTSESWHWFVLDVAIGREFAVTLHGVDLVDVAGPINREVQLAAIAESLRWHELHEPGSPNDQANAARGLRIVETGSWGSKPAALHWLACTGRSTKDAIIALRARLDVRNG